MGVEKKKKSELKDLISREELGLLPHGKQVMFACFCAEQVIHLVSEKDKAVCMRAIRVAYLFLEGKASQEECRSAAYAAAYANAAYAAANAAYAAANAAYAAYATAANAAYATADAASSKDRQTIIAAQWNFYDQLLNGDRYFEEIVLLNKESV